MKTAPVTDLKNRLSHYLRLVAKGETVTVLDRGKPVARISRIEAGDEQIDTLVAAGIARAPAEKLAPDFFRRRLARSRASVTEALRQDRDDRF